MVEERIKKRIVRTRALAQWEQQFAWKLVASVEQELNKRHNETSEQQQQQQKRQH